MSERKPGWYWVKCCENCRWEAAELHADGEWSVVYPYEVGPRIPTPDEPWQAVPVEPTERMVREGIASDAAGGIVELAIYLAMLGAAPKPEDS